MAALLGVCAFAVSPASASGVEQVSGESFYDTERTVCPAPPEPYTSYPALVLSGDLEGCWYTKVTTSVMRPSGTYFERGEELFIGSLDGGPVGTFTTTYQFEAKFAPDGTEIRGRCQHKIVEGSGTGGFAGVSGLLLYKDAPPTYFYRGHLSF